MQYRVRVQIAVCRVAEGSHGDSLWIRRFNKSCGPETAESRQSAMQVVGSRATSSFPFRLICFSMSELLNSSRQIVLLGTGTSHGVPIIGCHCPVCSSTNPRNQRTRTGVAVQTPQGTFLVDTSPELRIQLLRERIDLVHAVIYTHSHADHLFGLDDLRLFGYRLKQAIPLYCEPLVETQIRAAYSYAFAPPDPDSHYGAVPQLRLERIGLDPFDLLGVRVQPIRLIHGKLPVLGFRFGNVAFCTDVSFIPEESWPLLEGLDVFIVDALRDEPHATHFGIPQALAAIERVRPRRAYLTHVSHYLDYDQTNARLPEGVELAYDGLRIPF